MSDPENGRHERPIPISTAEFDRKVEAGEDINDHLDWDNAVAIEAGQFAPEIVASLRQLARAEGPPLDEQTAAAPALHISLPPWAYAQLKSEATRQGISQEDLAQILIVQRLDKQKVSS